MQVLGLSGLLRSRIKVMQIYGIPVFVNYSWLIVFVLATLLLTWGLPLWGEYFLFRLTFGFLASIAFFGSVLLHEIAHARVAKREGIAVSQILLHPFGGLAVMEKEPDTPRAEFRIAIAGPMMSLLISILCLSLVFLARLFDSVILMSLFALLFFCNFFIAIFNLFPGYPLDGGRVLRALLWKKGMDLKKATLITGKAGQIIAMALIFLGFTFALVRNDFVSGIWIGLVGFFLWESAHGIVKKLTNKQVVRAEQVMRPSMMLSPDMSIAEFLNAILPLSSQEIFPVGRDGKLYGLFLLKDLESVHQRQWQEKKIIDLMRVVRADYFVESAASIFEVKELMKTNGVGAVAVIDENGKVLGLIDRSVKNF